MSVNFQDSNSIGTGVPDTCPNCGNPTVGPMAAQFPNGQWWKVIRCSNYANCGWMKKIGNQPGRTPQEVCPISFS